MLIFSPLVFTTDTHLLAVKKYIINVSQGCHSPHLWQTCNMYFVGELYQQQSISPVVSMENPTLTVLEAITGVTGYILQ